MPHGFCIETYASGTRIEGERKEGKYHGKITYYQVNNTVKNEVWSNNARVQTFSLKSPEDAWFGNGQPIIKNIKSPEALVTGWIRNGYNARDMRKID